jgi:hypothetical protein
MTSDALLSSLLERIHRERRDVHHGVLGLVEDLTDEQLRWRRGRHAPSIGFHVWHLARYADKDRSDIEGTPQFWVEQSLAVAWGFPATLGEADTGTELGDDASDLLVLPSKAALLDYTRVAFNELGECLTFASSLVRVRWRTTVPSLLAPVVLLLLVASCGWLGYDPNSVMNDTSSLQALCQSTSSTPEFIIVKPGKERDVHSDLDCSVFDPEGNYVACLRIPEVPKGLTILVSTADSSVPADSCPNSSLKQPR